MRDQHFKGQQDDETVICFFRHHWISILKEFVYLALIIGVLYIVIRNIDFIKNILRGNREMKLLFLTGFLFLTILIHRIFIQLINYFMNIGILTDIRIIDHKKTLFFTDTKEAIDMAQVQEIGTIQNGILPSILGYGDIKIYLTASNSTKVFQDVPNVKFHFRCINRQKEVRKHGMIKPRGTHGITEEIKEKAFTPLSSDPFSKNPQ